MVWSVLGVNTTDSRQVIKKSFVRKSLILHPDKTKAVLGADDAMKLVTLACDVLSDQESRHKYDMRKEEAGKYYDFFKECSAKGTSLVPFARRSIQK